MATGLDDSVCAVKDFISALGGQPLNSARTNCSCCSVCFFFPAPVKSSGMDFPQLSLELPTKPAGRLSRHRGNCPSHKKVHNRTTAVLSSKSTSQLDIAMHRTRHGALLNTLPPRRFHLFFRDRDAMPCGLSTTVVSDNLAFPAHSSFSPHRRRRPRTVSQITGRSGSPWR